MKATFEKSVDVLVRAYMNDTLERRNCYACAVGNLVAAANGYRYMECTDNGDNHFFSHKLALVENNGSYNRGSVGGNWFAVISSEGENELSKIEIDSIGYTNKEIKDIEEAFERASSEDDAMFNGLLAVVDVLAEIHNIDLSVKDTALGRFSEIHATK